MGFKENLKNELDYLGMYVKELAALSGVKKQTIDGYLNTHEYTPSAENAVKIARVLGVTVEYLVTGEDNQRSCPPDGIWLPLPRSRQPIPLENTPSAEINFTSEIRQIIQTAASLSNKNRHIVLAIIKLIKQGEGE
jgi:transcriptional regulator with XRE-family HTH domain